LYSRAIGSMSGTFFEDPASSFGGESMSIASSFRAGVGVEDAAVCAPPRPFFLGGIALVWYGPKAGCLSSSRASENQAWRS
jgi:hypothetical protein